MDRTAKLRKINAMQQEYGLVPIGDAIEIREAGYVYDEVTIAARLTSEQAGVVIDLISQIIAKAEHDMSVAYSAGVDRGLKEAEEMMQADEDDEHLYA